MLPPDTPPDEYPDQPEGASASADDGSEGLGPLPEPEIIKIRNYAAVEYGAILALSGWGIRENAVDVSVLTRILQHFDRLVRIVRADLGGLEIKRKGRIVDVKGARRLSVVPAYAGSFVVALRLDAPEGQLLVSDHGELEVAMDLIKGGPEEAQRLDDFPERVGDELLGLFQALETSEVDLKAYGYREGQLSAVASVPADVARARAEMLVETAWSEAGVDIIEGTLFRIDTKRTKIAVDVARDEDEAPAIAEANFSLAHLEQLRAALHGKVRIEVEVHEQRRPYERTARSRVLLVQRVHGPLVEAKAP